MENPQHAYSNAGEFTVSLIVISPYGCRDTASATVQVLQDFTLYYPNCFTPNEDNKNDGFRGEGTGIDLNNYHLFIYNRWGGLVFKTDDLHEYWNGKTFNTGADDQIGVYCWVAFVKDVNGEKHFYKGAVTLLR